VVPAALPAAEALAFGVYAALGAPADSMRATEERALTLIHDWIDPKRRSTVVVGLLEWPATLAYPVLGLQRAQDSRSRTPQTLAQVALERADTATVRRILTDPRRQLDQRFGPPSADEARADALLWLAIGDTAAAARQLDEVLNSLPLYGARLLDDVEQPASLVRNMALRADLAARSGDLTTARHWAEAVGDLWSGADPVLQPLVAQARRVRVLPGR
jgi:hypothetical protein